MTNGSASPPHPPGTQQEYVTADGMRYYVHVPSGTPPTGGWPVLLFTHGIAEASETFSRQSGRWVQQDLTSVKAHASPAALCAETSERGSSLRREFIVISPQFPFVPDEGQRALGAAGRQWAWIDRAATIDRILGTVIQRHQGDRTRIFAAGFSRGGTGAAALAQGGLGNHRIAKLVLVDSERDLPPNPKVPTWVFYAGPATFDNIVRTHQPVISQAAAGGAWQPVPANGPVPQGQRLITDLQLNLGPPTLNHTEACRRAFADGRVYDWLLQ